MGRQKRSENTYQKINTIFKRDINNIIMPYDGYVMEELEYLKDCKFDAEEKIDGTNIRIEVTRIDCDDLLTWNVEYKGKTDNANVPKMLMEYLVTTYPKDKVLNALGLSAVMRITSDGKPTELAFEKKWTDDLGNIDYSRIPSKYTIYGEGYGKKIQTGGGRYLQNSNSFIGFDVKVDDLYLLRENRDAVFNNLGCPIVPFVGQFTIQEAIDFVRRGFISNISEDRSLIAEGLVLRTPMGLLTRRGERIIFKVKYGDFLKYRNMYGTDEKVVQEPNSNYL